ncbi:MAG: SGNH/GDSL hydrolase family protein [Pseudobdellovibrio sp.]
MKSQGNRFKYLAIVFAVAYIAWVSGSLLSQQKNTLHLNENWKSSKVSLFKGVVGAVAFVTTRVTLAREKIDFGAWHGFNEIILKDKMQPQAVKFDLSMEPNATLDFIFNKTENGFSGLRISANPLFSSGYFEADAEGMFTEFEKSEYSAPAFTTINVSAELGKEIDFDIDNQIRLHVSKSLTDKGEIGFRSQFGHTWLDNIYFSDHSGDIFRENFSSKEKIKYFVILSIFLSLVLLILRHRVLNNEMTALILFNAVCILTVIYFADWYYFSGRYPATRSQIDSWLHAVDTSSYKNNIESNFSILERAKQKISQLKKSDYVVILLGSSQTWGAGAKSGEEQFESYLEKYLNSNDKKLNVKVINLAVSGYNSQNMLEQLVAFSSAHPGLVILNAANNDHNVTEFEKNVNSIVNVSLRNKAGVALVQEANFINCTDKHLENNHDILAKIAKEDSVKLIPLHEYLKTITAKGIFWWDCVHMSSLGQRLSAEFISDQIIKAGLIHRQ